MSKRFTDTAIWEDDWFYELSPEYKLFWFYVKDTCDHAGIWKPKIKYFKSIADVEINLDKALEYFNKDKQRVRVLSAGYWLVEDFFYFQYSYKNKTINLNNRVHKSVYDLYMKHLIALSTINGLEKIITENGEVLSIFEYESIWGQH